MAQQHTFVIIGAGLAGAKAAEALRSEVFGGRVVLIGDEADRPYERPPLSKDYLQDNCERQKIYVHSEAGYAEHDIDLQLSTRATTINRRTRQVGCGTTKPITYDKLLLTTGSAPRPLSVPGADAGRVLYLRGVQDCERLKTAWKNASRLTVIGAGWIGLETAAAARAAGLDVTVLETERLPLLRVLGPEVAQTFADLDRSHGVDLRCGAQVAQIIGHESAPVSRVRLGNGSHVDADLVVAGVGVTPNIQLAEAASLQIDNGIKVDQHLRTSDNDIYAAGDVANAFHPLLGKHVRVEHWANALNQPIVAAKSMLGLDAAYDRLPYFYSDQYQLGMEYSGYIEPGGYDEVVIRGDQQTPEFVAFWLKDRRVLAGMNVNVWDVTDSIQALVRDGGQIDPAALADPQGPLNL